MKDTKEKQDVRALSLEERLEFHRKRIARDLRKQARYLSRAGKTLAEIHMAFKSDEWGLPVSIRAIEKWIATANSGVCNHNPIGNNPIGNAIERIAG